MAKHFSNETPHGEVAVEDPLDRELRQLLASENEIDLTTHEGVQQASQVLLEALDDQPAGKYSAARFEIVPAHKRSKPKNWEDRPVQNRASREPKTEASIRTSQSPNSFANRENSAKSDLRREVKTTLRVVEDAQGVEKSGDIGEASFKRAEPRRPYRATFSRRLTASPSTAEFSLEQALAGFVPAEPAFEPLVRQVEATVEAPSSPVGPKRKEGLAKPRPTLDAPIARPVIGGAQPAAPEIVLPATGFDLEFWLDGQPVKEKAKRANNLLEALAYNRLTRTSLGLVVAVAMTYLTTVSEMQIQTSTPADQLAVAERTVDQSASRSGQSVATPVLAVAPTPVPEPTTTAPPTTAPPPPPQSFFGTPVDGKRTSGFGNRTNPVTGVYRLHAGLDYAEPTGTPIKAAATGTVTKAGWTSGYGNYTCILHDKNVTSCYAHQSSINVKVGQKVNRGDVIGKVGNTGNSTGPHLHFEAREGTKPVDPMEYL